MTTNCDIFLGPGELTKKERVTLYRWLTEIVDSKHDILEVGTGIGGSCGVISMALSRTNPNGLVYACDPQRSPSDYFFESHSNVRFSKLTSCDLIRILSTKKIELSFIFFDGPETPSVAIDDIITLQNSGLIKHGSYFAMHDWETSVREYDKAISSKALLIRPYIECSSRWNKIECLDGINMQDTVGMCLYRFNG